MRTHKYPRTVYARTASVVFQDLETEATISVEGVNYVWVPLLSSNDDAAITGAKAFLEGLGFDVSGLQVIRFCTSPIKDSDGHLVNDPVAMMRKGRST